MILSKAETKEEPKGTTVRPNFNKWVAEHWFELIPGTKCRCTCRSFPHIPRCICKAVPFEGTRLACSPISDLGLSTQACSRATTEAGTWRLGGLTSYSAESRLRFSSCTLRLLDLVPSWQNACKMLHQPSGCTSDAVHCSIFSIRGNLALLHPDQTPCPC